MGDCHVFINKHIYNTFMTKSKKKQQV